MGISIISIHVRRLEIVRAAPSTWPEPHCFRRFPRTSTRRPSEFDHELRFAGHGMPWTINCVAGSMHARFHPRVRRNSDRFSPSDEMQWTRLHVCDFLRYGRGPSVGIFFLLCAKIRVGVTQGRIRHQLATESQRCVSRRRLKSITQLHLHRLRPFLVLKGAHLFSALKATGRAVSAARRMYGRRLARLSCTSRLSWQVRKIRPRILDFHFRTVFTNFFSSPGSTFSRASSGESGPLFLELTKIRYPWVSQNIYL